MAKRKGEAGLSKMSSAGCQLKEISRRFSKGEPDGSATLQSLVVEEWGC